MKDLGGLLKQAQDLQAKMADMQAKLETLEVDGEKRRRYGAGDAERQKRHEARRYRRQHDGCR